MNDIQLTPQRSNNIHPINRLRRKLQNAEERANTYLQLALAEIPVICVLIGILIWLER